MPLAANPNLRGSWSTVAGCPGVGVGPGFEDGEALEAGVGGVVALAAGSDVPGLGAGDPTAVAGASVEPEPPLG